MQFFFKISFLLLLWIYHASTHSILNEVSTFQEEELNTNSTSINDTEIATFDQIIQANEHAHILEFLDEGDIRRSNFRNAHGQKWPKSKDGYVYVPYVIEAKYSTRHKEIIRTAFASFRQHTCIRFIPRKKQSQYLSIESRGGCWSYVGRTGFKKQPVSLDRGGCVHRGTAIHELMHAIGFEHEQSRSDRDKYIRVMYDNISGGNRNNNFHKYSTTKNLVIYDYTSIMHYSKGSFSKHRLLPAIEIYPRRNPEPSLGFRHQMSPYDIEEIKYYYECKSGSYKRCGKDFTNKKRGTIQSPNYPKNYPSEAHCTWRITVSRGKYVKLTFGTIDITDSTLCELDAVIVHNGRNGGAPVIRRLCGKKSDVSVTSTGNQMFVIFTSNPSNARKGFRATFTEVSAKGNPPPAIPTEPPIPAVKKFSNGFRCNFDKDMCGMTQDKIDDIDFRRRRGSTPSRRTGPTADHTSGRGQYIYLEASSARFRDNAIIRSPWFKRSSRFCVKFSYHMYGSSMGALRLFAYEKIKNSKKGREKLLWEKFENQGNRWHERTQTYRPASNVEYMQFYWEAINQFEYSDVALDDIQLNPGSCNSFPSPTSTPKPATRPVSKTNCNFEKNLCGYKQVKSDKFDWTRQKGRTSTSDTGPSRDHTSGSGYYMYIEASAPRKQRDVAQLESPRLTYETHCVKMWYHMNGRNIGRLTLYKEIKGVKYRLRQIQGSKGNEWRQLTVNLTTARKQNPLSSDTKDMPSSNSYMKLVIEASVGSGSKGDIAIDDVVISDKPCAPGVKPTPTPAAINRLTCNFESGNTLCGLRQISGDQFDWTRHRGSTPTKGTGPTVDNTRKTATGYYIYIETSKPRRPNDEAVLSTPSLRNGRYCVRFAYHMFGEAIGRLTVLSQEVPNGARGVRWTGSRSLGNQWHEVSFQYNSIHPSKSVQFRFIGRVGSSSSGDIALDDIRITPGDCPSTRTTTPRTTTRITRTTTTRGPTTVPYTTTIPSTTVRPAPPSRSQEMWSGMPLCTFESNPTYPQPSVGVLSPNDRGPYRLPTKIRNDRMCGWIQSAKGDDFDWTRSRGATPSKGTGPSGDKTTGRGRYLFIESSSPRKPNDVALIQSYFMPAYEYCLHLNYHMFGNTMGKLVVKTVQILADDSRRRPQLHEFAGGQGNQWRSRRINFIPMNSAKSVAFRLEGVVGSGSKSDIAVDDITILPGLCNACATPSHTRTISSNEVRKFAAGCIHARLFYVRCCGTNEPKFIYRNVRNCNGNMFRPSQLHRFCGNAN